MNKFLFNGPLIPGTDRPGMLSVAAGSIPFYFVDDCADSQSKLEIRIVKDRNHLIRRDAESRHNCDLTSGSNAGAAFPSVPIFSAFSRFVLPLLSAFFF